MAQQCEGVHVAGLSAVLHQAAHQLHSGGVKGGLWEKVQQGTGQGRAVRSMGQRATKNDVHRVAYEMNRWTRFGSSYQQTGLTGSLKVKDIRHVASMKLIEL